MSFRSGYITLIGRPNAGKSTLLNQVLGGKLAITSPKPQTTRDRIVGIYTDESSQAVLLDTPGVHTAWTELNKSMVRRAEGALDEADVVWWLLDAAEAAARFRKEQDLLTPDDLALAKLVSAASKPVIVVANKLDLIQPNQLLPIIAAVSEAVEVHSVIPVSAKDGAGVPELLAASRPLLPEGPPHFPAEHWTEATERFLAAEIIREQIFLLTEQEIPYASYVEVEAFDESAREERGLVKIRAVVVVERPQQKAIVIGKGGRMIKRIGTEARQEIAKLVDAKVHLELFVKVEPNWSKSAKGLRKVGFER